MTTTTKNSKAATKPRSKAAPKPGITLFDPVNSTMICDRLKIDASALSQWQARYDSFPKPKIHLGANTKIWEWAEVKDWHKQHRG